jgi:hypothetical protein
MTVKGANRSTRREKWPIATSSLKKSHVYWLGSNPGLPQCISDHEVTFRGNIWGDFYWWFTSVPADGIMTWNAVRCSVGVTEAGLRGLEEPEQMLQEVEGNWRLCLKRVFFLCDSCRLTARDAMWETILSVWVDVEFRDPPCWVVWMLLD